MKTHKEKFTIVSIYTSTLRLYRKWRVFYRRSTGNEPTIEVTYKSKVKYYGNKDYGGWAIPSNLINSDSVVVDIGLGEDISFSESLIREHGCHVHGFDPTPKSIEYIKKKSPIKFQLYQFGVAGSNRIATFFLPNNPNHISGSIQKSSHIGNRKIDIELINLDRVLKKINQKKIDILKIDIEGAEYELINSDSFKSNSASILIICIEFHHRWSSFGPKATLEAVSKLKQLGFECVWRSHESNEEFTFINTKLAEQANQH